MTEIREWVERTLGGPEPKVIIEAGAHDGSDTRWLAAIPGAAVFAFEADPRNARPADLPACVLWHQEAIGSQEGVASLTPSLLCRGEPWTESSSIKRPTGHLTLWPFITFGDPIPVPCTTLDAIIDRYSIERIDLIWADIQGAEPDMIRGGQKALARTRYLYMECRRDMEYEGQLLLPDLLALLPGWLVIERYTHDVLLRDGLIALAHTD